VRRDARRRDDATTRARTRAIERELLILKILKISALER